MYYKDKAMIKGNITLTLSKQIGSLKIQGTCENLNKRDVLSMIRDLYYQIDCNDIMKGLKRSNGGYFEETVKIE